MNTVVADIEGDGFLDDIENIWQITIAEKTEGEWLYESYHHDSLSKGLERLRDAGRVVGHNFIGYDVPAIEKVSGVVIDLNRVVDTLVLSRLGNPERDGGHSLGNWGNICGFPKVDHEDWSQWSPEMEHRCNVDVELNVRVWETLEPMLELMPVAVKIEHATAIKIAKMCRTGIHFDEAGGYELLGELLEEVERAKGPIEAMLPYVYKPKGQPKALKRAPNKAHWAYGNMEAGSEFQEVKHVKLKVSSRQDVVRWLKDKFGWVPTEKTKTGQARLNDEVLRGLPWPECEQLADYFKAWKIIGYLNSEIQANGAGGGWLHHVTQEGKLHAGFIPLTAVTGRPSCAAPNLQQVPTDARVRRLFGPRAGWVQVGVDADGQELRCLGHYMHPFDNGSYAREVIQGDIHTKIQKLIGFHSRDTTKPVEYALIYGGGDPKLGLLAMKDCLKNNQPIDFTAPARGKEIRADIMYGLTGFKKLLEAVKLKAKKTGKLRGLDGRTLWVRSPHSALNLIMQSAGIIHMKMAISMYEDYLSEVGLKEDEDYALILWVHDELQFECKPEVAELLGKTVAKCLEDAAEVLGFKLPMTGAYQIGNNWGECH